MTIKNGLSIRAYNSPLPIVNLQLSKALTDTFYDPRASSLPVTPPPPPLPPHTPPTKHLLAPQGGVQFQTSRVNCKNVECFRPSPPFSPPLFSLHLIRVASSMGGLFQWKKTLKSKRSRLTMTPLTRVIQESSIDSSLLSLFLSFLFT